MSIDLGKKVSKSCKKHGNLSYFYSYHGYDKKGIHSVLSFEFKVLAAF